MKFMKFGKKVNFKSFPNNWIDSAAFFRIMRFFKERGSEKLRSKEKRKKSKERKRKERKAL